MPEKDNKIQPRRKIYRFHLLSKVPFIIYADLEPLLEKIDTCHNNHQQAK